MAQAALKIYHLCASRREARAHTVLGPWRLKNIAMTRIVQGRRQPHAARRPNSRHAPCRLLLAWVLRQQQTVVA